MSAENNPEGKKPFFRPTLGGATEEMIEPTQIQTVYVDQAMVGVDYPTQIATVSLLTTHAVPALGEEKPFKLDKISWELVGELKIPFNAMDSLCAYYLSTRAKDREGCYKTIMKFLADPPTVGIDATIYGPTGTEYK